jgi:hypothetical protein
MFHNTFILDQLHTKRMGHESTTICKLDLNSDKVVVDAVCVNCNKRFTSIRAISMHIKVTAARHAVTFSNHGVYDKKTGLRTNYYNTL